MLSVLVSAQDCKVEPTGHEFDGRRRALGYFQTFIEALVGELSDAIEPLLGKPTFLARLNGTRKRRVEEIEELLLELLDLSQSGGPGVRVRRLHGQRAQERNARSHGAGAHVGAQAHVTAGGPPGRGPAPASRRTPATSTRQRRRRAPREPGGAPLRARASARRPAGGAARAQPAQHPRSTSGRRWTPTAATAIQPEFAELLKRTFAGAAKVSVKIATNRYQTRFSNRGAGAEYRGLEVGAAHLRGQQPRPRDVLPRRPGELLPRPAARASALRQS